MSFEQLIAAHKNNGRVCRVQFLEALQKTPYKKRFMQILKDNPDLSIPAAQYVFLKGRHKCRCGNTTKWQPRAGGYFAKYCSSKCQNSDPKKLTKQRYSTSNTAQKERDAVKRFIADHQISEIRKISNSQIRQFSTIISSISQKREYDILKKLPYRLKTIWANLPFKKSRSKLLVVTGKIPLIAHCKLCGIRLTEPQFYGWSTYCTTKCSTKATAKIRVTKESTKKAGETLSRRLSGDSDLRSRFIKNVNTGAILENFVLGRRTVQIQGYEKFALQLLKSKYRSSDIIVSSEKKIPTIHYINPITQKDSHYYPDIFLKSKNRLIEVKSLYWLCGTKNRWEIAREKAKATIRAGFGYRLYVFDRYGTRLRMPKNLWDLSYQRLRRFIDSRYTI